MNNILHRIIRRLRSMVLSIRYGIALSKHVSFGKRVNINNPKLILWGGYVSLADDVELCLTKSMEGITPRLIIGNNVRFGRMNRIGCDNKIIIEDDVLFAPHVHISDRNHGFEDVNTPIYKQPVTSKGPVRIGRETWLGFGCQVMSGVSIGRHCVVAAGAVVVKDVPDFSVVGGNPAKILKRYNPDTKRWEKA